MIKRFLLGLLLVGLLAVPGQAQVSGAVGGMVANNTFPLVTPPCTTNGYSVDLFVDLPTTFDAGVIIEADEVNNRLYVMTEGVPFGPGVCVLDAVTLALQGACLTLTNTAEIVDEQIWDGVVLNSGEFWFFHRKPFATGCTPVFPGNSCVGTRVFNGNVQTADVDFLGVDAGNIDSVRYDSSTDLVWMKHANAVGARGLTTFNGAAKTLATLDFGNTSDTGGSLIVIDEANDLVYYYSNPLNSVYRTPQSSFSETSVALTIGGSRQYLSMAQDTERVGVVTDNVAVPGLGQWVDKGDFTTASRQTLTYLAADGGAMSEPVQSYGLHFDAVNSSYHSMRENAATNFIKRLNVPPLPGNITLGSEVLLASAGTFTNNGGQQSDFISKFASLYLVNNSSPARVFKINVCATGGP